MTTGRRAVLGAALLMAMGPWAGAQAPGSDTARDTTRDTTRGRDSTARRAPQPLPQVSVSAEAPVTDYRLVGFEQRRRVGRGQFLTQADLRRMDSYNLPEALRSLRGVIYECGGGRGCFVRMSRAPMRCLPSYIVDGQSSDDFGPLTPIRDIVAIEVYTGPSDMPGEYAGSNAACGAIVVWTRSGPDRHAPKPQ